MSTLERVPLEARHSIIERLKLARLYEEAFPAALARALCRYHDAPGAWLFSGWHEVESIVTEQEAEDYLARIIESSAIGTDMVPTRAKMLCFRGWLKADRLRFAEGVMTDVLEALPRYPNNVTDAERVRIESSIRATFGVLQSMNSDTEDDHGDSTGLRWAKSFWRTNWQLYSCRTLDTPSSDEQTLEQTQVRIRAAREVWLEEISELNAKFIEAARDADPDLYNPDRAEVLMGMVSRALRATAMTLDTPRLWSNEHGSSLIRSLAETRIVFSWLVKRDDPELFLRFKQYGRGRLKLQKLHLEEYRDSLDGEHPELDDQIQYLDRLVNQDTWEEFQEISIEGNFAGIDTRKMATEVNMMREYRLLFAPASSIVHGEWASLDEYALQRCRNPLHRLHRIPRQDLSTLLGPQLCATALDLTMELVDDYISAVRDNTRSARTDEGEQTEDRLDADG